MRLMTRVAASFALFILILPRPATAQFQQVARFVTPDIGPIVLVGNVNGDAFPDLVVTGRDNTALIYLGQASGLSDSPTTTVALQLFGPQTVTNRSFVLADVTSDGRDDLIVGQPGAYSGIPLPIAGAGAVLVFPGLSTPPYLSPTSHTILISDQSQQGANFGWSVAAGDFNGDGRRDILIGESRLNFAFIGPGRAHVFFQPAGGFPAGTKRPSDIPGSQQLLGGQNNDHFGSAVAAANVVGGRQDDAVIGSPDFAGGGRTQVFAGGPSGLITTPNTTLSGFGSQFGRFLALGDVDGSGFADVAITATSGIRVFLSNGTTVSPTPASVITGLAGPYTESQLRMGDVNNDGLADLLVGGGVVYVFAGRTSPAGVTTPGEIVPRPPLHDLDGFGTAIAVGDVFSSQGNELIAATQTITVTSDLVFFFSRVVCGYSIAPTSATYGAGGGSGSVTISTPGGCPWTVTNPVSWISISPLSGTGPATLTYSVQPNLGSSSRTGTLTIAGQSFTVTQAGQAYVLTVLKAGTGSGTVTSTPPGIDCGTACSAGYGYGTEVRLTATSADDSTFVGWSGDPGCPQGQLWMDGHKTCTAAFDSLSTPDISFAPPRDFDVGGRARAVAIGYLDGDAFLDLAVATSAPDRIAILLGAGDGSFGPPAYFPVDSFPSSIAIGDFNGDGIQDLAVANFDVSTPWVSILLGDGTGSFVAAQSLRVSGRPFSVAAANLNADGTLDLVATTDLSNIAVFLGNGDGSFSQPVYFETGGGSRFVAIADFDMNGTLDLAVTGNVVSILLGNGDGSFVPATPRDYLLGSSPQAVATRDVSGDGRPDLAVGNSDGDKVYVLVGNGDGSFEQPARSFVVGRGWGPMGVAIDDLNGDWNPDLVTANRLGDTGTVSFLAGQGDGSFREARNFGVGSGPRAVAIGDLDIDGKPDLAVALEGQRAVAILLNRTP